MLASYCTLLPILAAKYLGIGRLLCTRAHVLTHIRINVLLLENAMLVCSLSLFGGGKKKKRLRRRKKEKKKLVLLAVVVLLSSLPFFLLLTGVLNDLLICALCLHAHVVS